MATPDYANAPNAHAGVIFKPVLNIVEDEIPFTAIMGNAAIIVSLERLVNMYPQDSNVTASGSIVMSHGTTPREHWRRNFIDVSAFSYIQAPCNSPYKEMCCFEYPRGADWATISAAVKEIVTNNDGSVNHFLMRSGEKVEADEYISAMPVDIMKRFVLKAW